MPTDEEKARIAALEQELAELKDRPLTIAEIRELTPQQAQERWEKVNASLAEHDKPPADKQPDGPAPVGVDRMRSYYDGKAAEGTGEGS